MMVALYKNARTTPVVRREIAAPAHAQLDELLGNGGSGSGCDPSVQS